MADEPNLKARYDAALADLKRTLEECKTKLARPKGSENQRGS